MRTQPSMWTAAFLLGLASWTMAGDQERLARLERENAALKESLVVANQREKESAEALSKIRLRLSALGKNLFDGGDDRLVKAVAERELLIDRVRELEEHALQLSASIQSYLRTAVAADPDARVQVEVRLRELETLVGLRTKPQPNIDFGNLQESKVVSIDGTSGLLVLNIGERAGAQIGTLFEIRRGEQHIADAVVAETRQKISGLLVQRLVNDQIPVNLGDTASLKIQ